MTTHIILSTFTVTIPILQQLHQRDVRYQSYHTMKDEESEKSAILKYIDGFIREMLL